MFIVEQTYDLAGLTALCRAMRKTVRRIWCAVRVICWGVFAVGLLLWLVSVAMGIPEHMLLAASAVLLVVLLTEDRLNALISRRLMIPGTAHSVTTFSEDAYTVKTDSLETQYHYANITRLCETERYFFLFLGNRHGQIFDKQCFQTGSPDEFRVWMENKTGKTIQTVK